MTETDRTVDYPRDVPPEVLSMADSATLRMHRLLDGMPLAMVVQAYRAGRCDADANARAALVETLRQREKLIATLTDVLRSFHEKGHPGEPCIRTGWVKVATFNDWHATLDALPAVDTSSLFPPAPAPAPEAKP